MKFTEILIDLIIEDSRFKVLYDKIVKPSGEPKPGEKKPKGLMDFNTLKDLILADPTTKIPQGMDADSINEKNMENIKVGKYSQWLIKNFLTPKKSELKLSDDIDQNSPEYKTAYQEFKRLYIEDLSKTTQNLRDYEVAKPYLPQEQRDINKLTPDSLFIIMRDFTLPEKKRKETEKKEIRKTRSGFQHEGGKIIHEGPKWTVIKISDTGSKGKDAAAWYGGFQKYKEGESNWCTSPPDSRNFDYYIKQGPLYVVFPNNDNGQVGQKTGLPKERYQFHFQSSQFMDRDDRQINLVEFLNGKMSELKETFKPEFILNMGENIGDSSKIDITYPNDKASKYIVLYGFDELIKNLPKNLEVFNFVNSSKENISLDIPSEIGNLTNLRSLMLCNIVKTLPESIGKLKNLSFLNLKDNKNLNSLPKSIDNLPDLEFIHLGGTGIKTMPEFIKNKFDTMDPNSGIYYLST
jgi:hypothetical protein